MNLQDVIGFREFKLRATYFRRWKDYVTRKQKLRGKVIQKWCRAIASWERREARKVFRAWGQFVVGQQELWVPRVVSSDDRISRWKEMVKDVYEWGGETGGGVSF